MHSNNVARRAGRVPPPETTRQSPEADATTKHEENGESPNGFSLISSKALLLTRILPQLSKILYVVNN